MSVYKYSRWSFGEAEALINAVGEEVAKGLASGELTAVRVGQTVEIHEAIKTLFDRHGRRIPPRGLVANVCDPNREFHLVQPGFDYGARLALFEGAGLASFISGAVFEAQSRELLQLLGESREIKNLLNGVHLPVVIPQTTITDLGRTTEEFVTTAGKSYCRQFPERSFKNYRQGELEGQVTIVEESRYERLIESVAKSSLVGIYFPNPLHGFSVDAQREQMATLPEGFVLSGPLDTAMGWVMYPDVLARDYKTQVNDCSAVQWRSSEFSLYFRAIDDKAYFVVRAFLSYANDCCSGGLFFIG